MNNFFSVIIMSTDPEMAILYSNPFSALSLKAMHYVGKFLSKFQNEFAMIYAVKINNIDKIFPKKNSCTPETQFSECVRPL